MLEPGVTPAPVPLGAIHPEARSSPLVFNRDDLEKVSLWPVHEGVGKPVQVDSASPSWARSSEMWKVGDEFEGGLDV